MLSNEYKPSSSSALDDLCTASWKYSILKPVLQRKSSLSRIVVLLEWGGLKEIRRHNLEILALLRRTTSLFKTSFFTCVICCFFWWTTLKYPFIYYSKWLAFFHSQELFKFLRARQLGNQSHIAHETAFSVVPHVAVFFILFSPFYAYMYDETLSTLSPTSWAQINRNLFNADLVRGS